MATRGRLRQVTLADRARDGREIKDNSFPIEASVNYSVGRLDHGYVGGLAFREGALQRSSVRYQSGINYRRRGNIIICDVCVARFTIMSLNLAEGCGFNYGWEFRVVCGICIYCFVVVQVTLFFA